MGLRDLPCFTLLPPLHIGNIMQVQGRCPRSLNAKIACNSTPPFKLLGSSPHQLISGAHNHVIRKRQFRKLFTRKSHHTTLLDQFRFSSHKSLPLPTPSWIHSYRPLAQPEPEPLQSIPGYLLRPDLSIERSLASPDVRFRWLDEFGTLDDLVRRV